MPQHRWSSDLRRVIQRFLRIGLGRDERPILRASAEPPVVRLPDKMADVVRGLADHEAMKADAFRRRVVWEQELADPDMRRFAVAFLRDLHKRGFPLFVVQCWRSGKEQDALFVKGVTKAKAGQSAHNYGMAVDVIHFMRGWDLTRKEWAVVGAIGKEVARKCNLKVTWGGDWKFWDPAHWELSDWKERKSAV